MAPSDDQLDSCSLSTFTISFLAVFYWALVGITHETFDIGDYMDQYTDLRSQEVQQTRVKNLDTHIHRLLSRSM